MTSRLITAGVLSLMGAVLWAVMQPTQTALPVQSDTTYHTVAHVIDGDTIVLTTGEKVRYIGIDTPELGGAQGTHECYALDARTRNDTLVAGKRVRLERDVSNTDSYGRLLRYVYIDDPLSSIHPDTSINEILVAEGYARARAYPPDTQYQDLLSTAHDRAHDAGYGLWGDTCNKNRSIR